MWRNRLLAFGLGQSKTFIYRPSAQTSTPSITLGQHLATPSLTINPPSLTLLLIDKSRQITTA